MTNPVNCSKCVNSVVIQVNQFVHTDLDDGQDVLTRIFECQNCGRKMYG